MVEIFQFKMNKYKSLKINGKRIDEHRLVAIRIFGEEACKGMVVHHKNDDRSDNRPENLELMTKAEHMRHHFADILDARKRSDNPGKAMRKYYMRVGYETTLNKKVEMLDLQGNHIRFFNSCAEAGRNGFTATHVAAVCRGSRRSHRNYMFRFA